MTHERRFFLLLWLVSGFTLPYSILLAQQEVQIRQDATSLRSGRYEWTLSLQGRKTVLNSINQVEYTLHPSYNDPIRTLSANQRRTNFSTTFSGKGVFTVYVHIVFRNGSTLDLEHNLTRPGRQFVQSERRPDEIHENVKLSAANTSKLAGKGKWEWAIFIVTDSTILSEINSVEYTLHPTFLEPRREVFERGHEAERGFYLHAIGWGTFVVGIKVTFRDGDVRYLKHQLVFDTTLE